VLVDQRCETLTHTVRPRWSTPNHHEALRLTNSKRLDEGLHTAAQKIRARLACDAVLVTRGDRGMMLVEAIAIPSLWKPWPRKYST